ncbi:Protein ODORANT1 [Acorus calamus]|uniref:Protein ODORANT1 n=1 Tax=Acorus calamus TaxID=4465 RepID=A0AAV9C8Z6_ACOCL|nr:Protein ODORANT1 [Acorus calamus]
MTVDPPPSSSAEAHTAASIENSTPINTEYGSDCTGGTDRDVSMIGCLWGDEGVFPIDEDDELWALSSKGNGGGVGGGCFSVRPWNTHVKKRLTKLGIDPATHQPLIKPANAAASAAQTTTVDPPPPSAEAHTAASTENSTPINTQYGSEFGLHRWWH